MASHRQRAQIALDASLQALREGNLRNVNEAAREFAYCALEEFALTMAAFRKGELSEAEVRQTLLGRAVDELLPEWVSDKP